jgi:hypothetical protein
MEIAFSIRQTSFPRCFVCVFVLHYICVAIVFADQLLVSLDIGGMDKRYHQVIYSGYHHVQTRAGLTIWQKGHLPTGPALLGAPRFTQF